MMDSSQTLLIPEPRFLLAAFIPLAEMEERYFKDERPNAEHLRALLHMDHFNVPSDLPWRLVVGWRMHGPMAVTPQLIRSVSPVTSGSAEPPSKDTAVMLRLIAEEHFIDGTTGLLLADFQALLARLADYMLARRAA